MLATLCHVTDPNPATDATRVAIEFLTLWMETDRLAAAEHIAGVIHDPDGPEPDTAITGLLNLSMFLLFALAKANGADDYKAWAGEYLHNFSVNLPEAE